MNRAPQARTEGLIVTEANDEVLVYDLNAHRAHCPNGPAAVVWRHCDGRTEVADLTALLRSELGEAVDQEVVWAALDQLRRAHLLSTPAVRPPDLPVYRRRALLRKLGVAAALAMPMVATVGLQSAAAQASCIPQFQQCNPPFLPCCSGFECDPFFHQCRPPELRQPGGQPAGLPASQPGGSVPNRR